jgi:YD repeat-containing protein
MLFDADGNIRSRTPSGGSAATDAYDQANRLTGATAGGAISSYGFDGDGKRVSRTSGGTTNSYVYDTTGGLPTVLDDGQRKYVYGPSTRWTRPRAAPTCCTPTPRARYG